MALASQFEFFIQWHLTEKCNLRCSHCYQSRPMTHELTLPEIRQTIAETSDMLKAWSESFGISFKPSMNVSGGEPFLRNDIFTVLEEMKNAGYETYLLTNGTLIDRERAETLAVLGIDGVQVSIEGSEDVHDSLRGRGTFRAAAEGVAQLVARGLAVTLNVTLSDINAGQMQTIVDFVASARVKRVGFSRLVPSGTGKALMPHMISPEKLRTVYASLRSLSTAVEIVSGDPVAAQLRSEGAVQSGDMPTSGCAAGLSGLTIMPDGTVLPCRRMPVPIGNVRTDSLREIWATSPVLEALRDRSRYRGKCGTCSRWSSCRGCRAIAYATPGSNGQHDFLGEDPQCFL